MVISSFRSRGGLTAASLLLLPAMTLSQSGETVTDVDGNTYTVVEIGNQRWLRENLTSLNYCDGTTIPDVASYLDSDSLATVYGRLYTWDAAMAGSKTPGAQGACPCGWHIPTDEEWKELEDFLGGAAIAGGFLKEAGTEHWAQPNTGADNSSAFSALPGGEYDAHSNPARYQLLRTHAVFWTSTEIGPLLARERYLSFDSPRSGVYDWYKVMRYSVRCVADAATSIKAEPVKDPSAQTLTIYPNPFNSEAIVTFTVPAPGYASVTLYNLLGQQIAILFEGETSQGTHKVRLSSNLLATGMYLCRFQTASTTQTANVALVR